MRRAMAIFFSFILVFTLTLPKPCSAYDIFADKKQVMAQFLDYLFPHYSLEKNLARPEIKAKNIGNDSTDLHTLYDVLHRGGDFLPTIHNLEVHDNMIWSIEFNNEINPNSITNETLYILNSKGERIPTLIINDSMKTINILPPLDKYDVGETYFLHLTNEIESAMGEKMHERFVLQFSIQDIDFLKEKLPPTLQLNFSFETGYEGLRMDDNSPVDYEYEFLNQLNENINNLQVNDEFLLQLIKKFDAIEEQRL